jgi:hypothetical protein
MRFNKKKINLYKPTVCVLSILVFSACSSGGGSSGGNTGNDIDTQDTAKPQVIDTRPMNNVTDIAINTDIAVTFSEDMEPSSISSATFTLTPQGESDLPVMGTVSVDGDTAVFDPATDLQYDTTYIATILNTAQDAAGNSVINDFSWMFTTEGDHASDSAPLDTTPPIVISTTPSNNLLDAPVNTSVSVEFSEPMNVATITGTNITMTNATDSAISGSLRYNNNSAIFTPDSDLEYATLYTLVVHGGNNGVKDLANNALINDFTVFFTTGPRPDTTPPTVVSATPANNQFDVPVNASVSIEFSEPMNIATIDSASVTMTDANDIVVNGTFSHGNNRVTFTPDSNLEYSTAYTLVVHGGNSGVKDVENNALIDDYRIVFTTISQSDLIPPSVISTSPEAFADLLETDIHISATFSERLTPATLNTDSFSISSAAGPVPGAISTTDETTFTFIPDERLDTLTKYTATLTTQIQDLSATHLANNVSWEFRTRPWTRFLGSDTSDSGADVATDSSGNLYVVGVSYGSLLDGYVNQGAADIVLAKYNAFGDLQWIRQLGSVGSDAANAVMTDQDGNVYVTGETTQHLDGSPCPCVRQFFVAKYNSIGDLQWISQAGAAGEAIKGLDSAIDSAGNIYVAGSTSGALDGFANLGSGDAFLVKMLSDGVIEWAYQFGSEFSDSASGVTVDAQDSVYIAGSTRGAIDGNMAFGGSDIYLMKFNGDGVVQWSRQTGSAGPESARQIVSDSAGNLYIIGNAGNDFNGSINSGGLDMVVLKYDSAGEHIWTRQHGVVGNTDYGYGIALGPHGGVFAVGNTNGCSSSVCDEVQILKYNTEGVLLWSDVFGSLDVDQARGVATDSQGNAYITGFTLGVFDRTVHAGGVDVFIVKYSGDGVRQ